MAAAQIIKALADLAWPLATVVVALSFKTELLGFLPSALKRRLKFEMPGGFKIEVDAIEQQQKVGELAKADSDGATIELKEIPGLSRTEAIARLERDLHARLKFVTAETVDVLVRNLAEARLSAAFGLIYAAIFGSQIAGLRELGARRTVSAGEAFRFYSEFAERYLEVYAGYGFSGWLGFLKDRGLVRQDGEAISMTPLGDDFLAWLGATGLSIHKPW